jgi:hypothetical protein
MQFSEWLSRRDENLYGVYCGPGPKLNAPDCDRLAAGQEMPSPKDSLDSACRDHDIAYCKAGADWRSAIPFSARRTPETRDADSKLISTIKSLRKSGKLPPGAERFSRLMARWFRLVQL